MDQSKLEKVPNNFGVYKVIPILFDFWEGNSDPSLMKRTIYQYENHEEIIKKSQNYIKEEEIKSIISKQNWIQYNKYP